MIKNSKKWLAIFLLLLTFINGNSIALDITHPKPISSTLNLFCFVVIEGYWNRYNLFLYILFEEISYWIGKYFENLAQIIFPIMDKFNELCNAMPIMLYHAKSLLCMSYEGSIFTLGLLGFVKGRINHESYYPMIVTLYGFTGIWLQKNHIDLAIGFAKCVVKI